MKKVKIKTKQKQKQSQTVNINLGNVLKKSKPRRKTQPKQQPNISQPITFNAPPIREYVDTSLYNIPSKSENPLLARSTINPIPDTPITINPISNTVGQIQIDNPLFKAQQKQSRITDEPPVYAEAYFSKDLPQYNPEFNLKPKKKKLTEYEIQLKKEEAKRKNELKKAETKRINEARKEATKILNEQLKAEKKKKIAIGQTVMPSFYNPEEPQTIISQPEQPQTIISQPEQPQPIDQGISRANIVGPILNKYPVFPEKPSVLIKKDIQKYSQKPEETQTIFLPPEEPKTIMSAPIEKQTFLSTIPEFQNEETLSPENIDLMNQINKAPQKRPAPEGGKKIVARPIKIDPNTGEPIKKQKKPKLNPNIILPEQPV